MVLAAMTAHAGNAVVQAQGCGALRNLSVNDDNKMAIAGAGGIEVVVAAMTAHAGNAGVQKFGCGALANLRRQRR